jgi:hypothetical protein
MNSRYLHRAGCNVRPAVHSTSRLAGFKIMRERDEVPERARLFAKSHVRL